MTGGGIGWTYSSGRVDRFINQHVYGSGAAGIKKMASANIEGPAQQPHGPRIYGVPYKTS